MFNSDFEKSVVGMEHHLLSLPKNHALFIPEVLVELERKHDTKDSGVEGITLTRIAKDHDVTLPEQEELLKLAEKAKREKHSKSDLDKGSIEALQAVEESIGNVDRQKEEYERLRAKAQEEKKIGSTGRNLPHDHTYEEIHNLQRHEMGENQHSSTSTTGKQQDSHGKLGDEYVRNDSTSHEHRGLEQHRANQRQQQGANQWQQQGANQLQQQGANQWQQQGANQWQQQGANQWQQHTNTAPPYQGNRADTASSVSAEQYGGMRLSQTPLDRPDRHHHNTSSDFRDDASRQKNQQQLSHLPLSEGKASQNDQHSKQSQNLPVQAKHEDRNVQKDISDIKAETGNVDPASMNLGVGSLIQIPSSDQDRLRYGTIKWTGLLPNVKGEIAGIELVNNSYVYYRDK